MCVIKKQKKGELEILYNAQDWMYRWPPLEEDGEIRDEFEDVDWETHRAFMLRTRSSSVQKQNQTEGELSEDQKAIIPFHEAILSKRSFVASDGKLQFPELPKEAIYNFANVFSAAWTTSVKQSEAILDIKGVGIRPVFLPFFTEEEVMKWKAQGYHYVHIGQIDILVSPKFNYD